MLDALQAMFSYTFLVRAIVVGLLVSLCAALLGVSLVLKRYAMIGDGLSHVSFGSLAIATVMGWAALEVTIPVVVLAAFFLLRLSERSALRGDAAIGLISTAALAIGVMVLSMAGGMNVDVFNYMFGSILAMSEKDVWLSLILSGVVLVMFVLFYHRIFAVTFDEPFASATGTRCDLLNMLIAALTAITIVLGMRMMGALLISGLIVIPPLGAMRICHRFRNVVIVSAVTALVSFFIGVVVSYLYATPTGASAVVVNLIFFCIYAVVGPIRCRLHHH